MSSNLQEIFRKLLWDEVNKDERTVNDIAKAAKVQPSVIHQLIYNKYISIDNLTKIGNVYGYKLTIKKDDRPEIHRENRGI